MAYVYENCTVLTEEESRALIGGTEISRLGGHPDPIGKMGPPGICPNCGKYGCMKWDPETGVTTCLCGWNNEKAAKENRKRRIKNGEIRDG